MINILFKILKLNIKYYELLILKIISSFFLSLILFFVFYNILINYFNKLKLKHKSKNVNKLYKKKDNTLTMGGIIMMLSNLLTILLISNIYNKYIIYSVITYILYGLIGLLDDYIKIFIKNNNIYYNGISILKKYILQSLISIFIIYLIIKTEEINIINKLFIPFYNKKFIIINKYIYFILSYLILVGFSNAVNITDGLDGLAITSIIMSFFNLSIIIFFIGNINLSKYFNLYYINNTYELINICFSIVGSGLGFLWFNSYPSNIFMGDIGSLSLGSLLSIIFIILRMEFLLLITGGLFIIELISVISQIFYFKIFNKRIYLMAPIHHHYEIIGLHESKIVTRFCIISVILNLIFISIIGIRFVKV